MANYKGTREAFAQAVMELAAQDDRILFVSADSLKAMRATAFAAAFPDKYIEVGIAEQNAVGVAAGLASTGLIPFVGTYSGFITMRAGEQMRTFAAYPGLNVKLVGINGGIFSGEKEGVTHQFFEDLGIVRTIPGITVIVPADAHQMYQAVKAAAAIEGPVYIRAGSGREHIVYDAETPFALGKIHVLNEYGKDVALFANGFIVNRAVEAASILRQQGIGVTLVDVPTLKPLDTKAIARVLKDCGTAVTVEDHNIIGGLGDAIAKVSSEECPVRIERVGLQDVFPSSGAAEEVLDYYGMSVQDIVAAVKRAYNKKQEAL
ncbi:putative membrane protein [Propionispora sp. 2/2-37]|uniref:transketolase family protein n=1 Tax=Propionispora sp. 2/2-37 TaxID=1677858 RepID=UPI0006BB68C8|nr:transketolase C-terminal domain-containing protein [Propionispora sp. 2/2-37]CUH96852.1 putative membrane protein [Propionispora sp. 2/2-37]